MLLNSENVKHLRSARQLTQEELALMADVSVRTIQRIETSGTASLETTRALASALSVPSDQLLATSPEYRSLSRLMVPMVLLVTFGVGYWLGTLG